MSQIGIGLSQKEKKWIKGLHYKKYRKMHGCFVVEGLRSVKSFLDAGYKVRYLVVTTTFMLRLPAYMAPYVGILRVVTSLVMQELSCLERSSDVLLVAFLQDLPLVDPKLNQRVLVLDDVRDPGNMGTIIRVAHWYGIRHVVVSCTTVDCYNPKVVQASMGALSWVRVYYTDLGSFLAQQREKGIPTIGCVLDGVNMYKQAIPNGCVVLGNEAKGIRKAFYRYLSHKITIPGAGFADSLNVGVAAGIICSHWTKL